MAQEKEYGYNSALICNTLQPARVVKLVDAGDSKSPAARRAGSIPAPGTIIKSNTYAYFQLIPRLPCFTVYTVCYTGDIIYKTVNEKPQLSSASRPNKLLRENTCFKIFQIWLKCYLLCLSNKINNEISLTKSITYVKTVSKRI